MADKKDPTELDGRRLADSPVCGGCAHLMGFDTCAAFPDGIPDEIWRGDNPHTSPYAGDHGMRFVPDVGVELAPDTLAEIMAQAAEFEAALKH